MRKQLATLMAVGLLSVPVAGARAQTTVGLITGISRATFTGGGASGVTWRTGFMGGGVVELPVGENLSMRSELYFATKGSRVRAIPGDIGEHPLTLSYLQFPVMAQLQPGREVLLRPHLFGGVSLALPLSCKYANQSCDEIDDVDHRIYDASVLVGAEIEVARIGVGVRYEAGLTPVLTSGLVPEFKHGVLSFTARYTFRR